MSRASFNPLNPIDTKVALAPNSPDTNRSAVQNLVGCDQDIKTQELFDSLAEDSNQLYGLNLLYYRHDFVAKESHPIYGDSNAEFLGPYLITAYVQITSDTSLLTQFGIENTNDVDVQISYDEWERVFGDTLSPQSGDKFEIDGLLCNRPSGFTRAIFEVTSQGDSDIFEVNRRWFISGQRSDFNNKPNEPTETPNAQVIDSAYAGLLDIDTNERLESGDENSTGRDIDDISRKNLSNQKSSIYGGYYFEEED